MMTEGQRLWRGLLMAVLLHIGLLAGLMLAGFLTPPPPAPPTDSAEVSLIDEPEPEIPVIPEEVAAAPPEEPELIPETLPKPPETEKPKALPPPKPESPPQPPQEKPPLPAGDRKNLFETEADIEKAFIAPILDKRQEPVIKPGTQPPLQPFVVIDIIIGRDGRVEKAAVSIPSGSLGVDQAAVDSVKQYLFIPGKDKQGKPIRCSFSITLIL